MSDVATPEQTYWSPERVAREVARGFPRFLAEIRLPPSPSFDASAPRPALVPLTPEPRPAVAAVRPVPPAPRPAPRLPRAAAPIQETLL